MFGWHILNYYMKKMIDSYFFGLNKIQTLSIKAHAVRLGVWFLQKNLKLEFGI